MFVYSDTGLKYDILPLSNVLPGLLSLNGYTFRWLSNGQVDAGLLASEVRTHFPSAVRYFNNPVFGQDDIKVVNYQSLIAIILQGMHEIHSKLLDAGTTRLNEQREDIEKVYWRVDALEQ